MDIQEAAIISAEQSASITVRIRVGLREFRVTYQPEGMEPVSSAEIAAISAKMLSLQIAGTNSDESLKVTEETVETDGVGETEGDPSTV